MNLVKSGPSRITRGPAPARIRKNKYREDSYEALLRDFEARCAYCLNHSEMLGGEKELKVDHFWPREKGGPVAAYDNLFLACDRCNRNKWLHWPDQATRATGVRFLNCCEEWDYNESIFENDDGTVYGTTPAAKYHISILILNRPDLVRIRRKRTLLIRELREAPYKLGVTQTEFEAKLNILLEQLDLLIPRIERGPEN